MNRIQNGTKAYFYNGQTLLGTAVVCGVDEQGRGLSFDALPEGIGEGTELVFTPRTA